MKLIPVVVLLVADVEEQPKVIAGRRIREARRALRLTQEDLAELAIISQVHVSAIERGEREPSTVVLRDLSRVLDLDYHEMAATYGWIDKESGDVPVHVPAAEARDTRWFASLPANIKQMIRKMSEPVLAQVRIATLEDASEDDTETAAEREHRRVAEGEGSEPGATEPLPPLEYRPTRRTKRERGAGRPETPGA